MKKAFFFVLILIIPQFVFAQRGCCSSNGGVWGCSYNGVVICNNGKYSPTCRCTPPKVYGCTDRTADNYDSKANTNNHKCIYKGCTDKKAENYDSKANKDDGSCRYAIKGCMDKKATNYNPKANTNDDSCEYISGCTDSKAQNYNPDAGISDGSCIYHEGCTDKKASNYDPDAVKDNGACKFIKGCMDENADNYDPKAVIDDSSCEFSIRGEEWIEIGIGTLGTGGIIGAAVYDYTKRHKELKNSIKYCTQCGNRLFVSQKYCTKCGNYNGNYLNTLNKK